MTKLDRLKALLADNPHLSNPELAAALSCTTVAISVMLDRLMKRGEIVRGERFKVAK